MVRGEKTKAAALLYVAITALLLFLRLPAERTGLYGGCPAVNRFLYPLFHVGLAHWALNAWCLVTLSFVYPISIWSLLVAYLISASFPVDSLSFLYDSAVPTVGASGVCYALVGRCTLLVRRKAYYTVWVLAFLSLGFLFPACNVWLHLYCYLCGLVAGVLNTPIGRDGYEN